MLSAKDGDPRKTWHNKCIEMNTTSLFLHVFSLYRAQNRCPVSGAGSLFPNKMLQLSLTTLPRVGQSVLR